MKNQLEKIKSQVTVFTAKYAEYLRGKLRWALPVIFLILAGYSVYLWYIYAFNPSWNEQRKKDYINTKQRDVAFEKKEFDSVISAIKERKGKYQNNLQNIPDIFRFR